MTTKQKLTRIIQHATYLLHYARDDAEREAALSIRALAQDIIDTQEDTST